MFFDFFPKEEQKILFGLASKFPETSSLEDGEPLVFCNLETLDFDVVLDEIKKSPEIAGFFEILASVIVFMRDFKDELFLRYYDQIRIYGRGLCIVCIKLKNNNNGVSVCLDFCEFHLSCLRKIFF